MIKMIEPTKKGIPFQAFICPNVKTTRGTLPHTNIPCGFVYCEPKKEPEHK